MQEYKKISITKDEIVPIAERMRKDGVPSSRDALLRSSVVAGSRAQTLD